MAKERRDVGAKLLLVLPVVGVLARVIVFFALGTKATFLCIHGIR